MKRLRFFLLLLFIILVAVVAGIWLWLQAGNPNALRQIVTEQCIPHQQPCAEVNLSSGYVVFKDRNGPYSYLLSAA